MLRMAHNRPQLMIISHRYIINTWSEIEVKREMNCPKDEIISGQSHSERSAQVEPAVVDD